MEDGYNLGSKVNHIRYAHQFLKGKDEAERRAWLESQPGWTWSVLDDSWETFRWHLLAHVDATGTSCVSRKFICPDGYNLGQRIDDVRNRHSFLKNKPDEAERRAFLECQPGWAWKTSGV